MEIKIRMLLTTGVVVTALAARLNEVYAAWLGGLITLKKNIISAVLLHFQGIPGLIYPTIPTLQWNTGLVTAQKYQMATSEHNVKSEREFWRKKEV